MMSTSVPPQPHPGAVPPTGSGTYYTPPAAGGVQRVVPGFSGVPARDYVMDVVAALLLLLSLGLPWNGATNATRHIEVLLITILSVLSLSLHYLYRAGVFPPTWTSRTVALTRGLLNVPYLVIAAIAVVLDLVSVLGQSLTITPGVGSAVLVGLAGAVLAAGPRAGEPDVAAAVAHAPWTRTAIFILAGVAMVLQVLGLVAPAVTHVYDFLGGSFIAYQVIAAVGITVLVAWALIGVGRGDDHWRPVIIGVGVTVVLWMLFVTRQYALSVSSGNLGVVVLPIAAVAVAVTAAGAPGSDRRAYGRTVAGNALLYVLVLAGFGVAGSVALLTGGGLFSTGTLVAILVACLIAGVAAVVGRSSLAGPTRMPAFVTLGVVLVAGIVILAVQGSDDWLASSWDNGLLAFGLPLVAGWALALPGANKTLASLFKTVTSPVGTVGRMAPTSASAPAPDAPLTAATTIQTPPPPPASGHGFTVQQAADPATDPVILSRIAAEAPELRACLATNPSTYPALLQWLADLHDPQVDAALQTRG